MSDRKLLTLGVSSQIPTRDRNQTGFLLRWDEEGFLFDPGEGTQRQMTLFGARAGAITKIFLTHFHGDHCLGLPGVIQRVSLDGPPRSVEIYYPASGQKYYKNLIKASVFFNAATLHPRPIEKEGKIFENDKMTVEAFPLRHQVECWGYRIQEKDSFTLLPGKLAEAGIQGKAVQKLLREGKIEGERGIISLAELSRRKLGQSAAFIMDTGLCRNIYRLADKVDLLVCESTFLSSEKKLARKYDHLTAVQAASIARKCGVKQLVLAHFSSRYPSIEAFQQEAEAIHPETKAVKDGDVVYIPRRARVLGGP